MTEGTKSVLFGCHSIIHSYYVIRAWKYLYNRYPKFWQIVCILLHDIGHVGLDYLKYENQKKIHWVLGAQISQMLFGRKAFLFCAGHTKDSGYNINSQFKKADKYSSVIASNLWLKWNYKVEDFGRPFVPNQWKKKVLENLNNDKDNHELYLELIEETTNEKSK